jgi:outer membrane protein TolC
MKFNSLNITCLFFLIFAHSFSQELLTKSEALKITLENNFGIKIANNNLAVAKNNSSIYNSGFLPTATLSSGSNYSKNNQTVTPQTGESRSTTGAITKSYNAALNLNYVIFDGLGRKYTYQQLKETYNLTELQVKETIENTYLQLFTSYFQIARLSENTSNLSEALAISKTRLQRAAYQYEYGQSTKLAYLNAEVDVNTDQIAFISSRQQLKNAKRGLNLILGVDGSESFSVETSVEFIKMMDFEEVQEKVIANNTLLKQNEKNIAISEFNIKINKSNYLPAVGFNSAYGWNKSNNENLANNFQPKATASNGFNAGLSLSWNLFDGGGTQTRVANAKISLENQKILLQQQKATVQNNLRTTWDTYNNQLFIIGAQEKNKVTAKNNFDRTAERFKLGQVSSIEFRQAQTNLLNSKTTLSNARFDAKLIELQLLQLSGDIMNIRF